MTTWRTDPDELTRRLRGRTRLFGALLVACVVPLFLPLPWKLAALGFALATVVVGIRVLFALSAVRRAGGRGTGFLGVSVGLGLASVVVVQIGLEAAFYPLFADQQDCLARASTLQAQERCRDATERRIDDLLGR